MTTIRNDTSVGTVSSVANVSLLDRVHVYGDVNSEGIVTLGNQVSVDGAVNQNIDLWIVPPPPVTVTFPPKTGDIHLEPDTTFTASPGSYGQVIVKSRSSLTLTVGTYYIKNLDLEPQANLIVDGTADVFIKNTWIQRGTVIGADDSHFTYMSTTQLIVESDLDTHLTAPNAQVMIRGHFSGTLTAKSLTADAGETLTCVPCTDCELF